MYILHIELLLVNGLLLFFLIFFLHLNDVNMFDPPYRDFQGKVIHSLEGVKKELSADIKNKRIG